MPHRVFLSFNCDRDAARAVHVAGPRGLFETCEWRGLLGRPQWAALERCGRAAVQRWIDAEISSSFVAVVLIGAETCAAPWVHYAIQRCRSEGKGMLGVRVHRLADPRTGLCDYRGLSPFEINYVTGSAPPVFLNSLYPTYDWVADAGERNLRTWIDAAAARANPPNGSRARPLGGPVAERSRPVSSCGFSSSRHVSDDWRPAAWRAEP
jgi:hypothetical protein